MPYIVKRMGKGKYSRFRPVFVSKEEAERLGAKEYSSRSKAQKEAENMNK